MAIKPTIYAALKATLGREPTHAEIVADVKRILTESLCERATQGKLKHQRKEVTNMATKPKLTREQKRALERYNFCLREEDRLGGSVFANALNTRRQEAKTAQAYAECLRLGMTYEHGL